MVPAAGLPYPSFGTHDLTTARTASPLMTPSPATGPTTVTRPVPAPPILVRTPRRHIAAHGRAPDGRLFVAQRHGQRSVSKETNARIWRAARTAAPARSNPN